MKAWVYERDYYTRIQHETTRFSTKEYIFVLEYGKIEVQIGNKVELDVWVSFLSLNRFK